MSLSTLIESFSTAEQNTGKFKSSRVKTYPN